MKFVKLYEENDFKINYLIGINEYIKKSNLDTLYEHDIFSTNKIYLNFLNQKNNFIFDRSIKKILESELLKLESISSGMGSIFLVELNNYFQCGSNDINKFIKNIHNRWNPKVELFQKLHITEFIDNNIDNNMSKSICKNILDYSPAGCSYYVNESNRERNSIKISQKIAFDVKFDFDLIKGDSWKRSEAKLLLVDGYIDSIGEIHHLLHKASEDLNPYLIICKGIREEVKSTVIHNNNRNSIDVMIVSLVTNEENVNILNDISSVTCSDIVSALKGDTISNSIKKELTIVKNISVSKKGITLKPIENNSIKHQREFLISKRNNLNYSDPNYSYISKRIKNLSNKRAELYFKANIKREVKVDIDYFLKFVMNGATGIVRDKNSTKLYTYKDVVIFTNSLKSILNVIENIGCCLLEDN
jgi:hypothetical protein